MNSGILLVDKPQGITSHDVVHRVRKILGQSSVGHAGTLDPLASGLLILLLGEATKLSDFLLNGDKGYEVDLRLGATSDTLDRDGQVVVQKSMVEVSEEALRAEMQRLSGSVDLEVPAFSAVKKKGKKLYEYARSQKEVELPRRRMEFFDIELMGFAKDIVRVRLGCSKGSYIRSWVHQLGQNLESGAIVEELRRFYSHPYHVRKSVTLSQLEDHASDLMGLGGAFVPLSQMLPEWKALTLSGRDEELMSHGQIPHHLSRRLVYEQKQANRMEQVVGIKVVSGKTGELLSILEAQPFKGLKIRRIFNRQTNNHGS